MKTIDCHACRKNPVEVEDSYEEEYCCAGLSNECGCMGAPINYVICDACHEKSEATLAKWLKTDG